MTHPPKPSGPHKDNPILYAVVCAVLAVGFWGLFKVFGG